MKFKVVTMVRRMLVIGIFLLFVETVYEYNIDVDFPIIYSSNNAFNYFGYTVHLYYEMDTDISW